MKLREDMATLVDTFCEYWMTHAEELRTEGDLSAEDASSARLPADVAIMTLIAQAEGTALALGEYPEYDDVTAVAFPSVRRQLLAQTRKRIRDYTLRDLVRAMDRISHWWTRIRVDEEVFNYVLALRLRYAVLMRVATVWPIGPASADGADGADGARGAPDPCGVDGAELLEEPAKLGPAHMASFPTLAFRQEMTHRFRALADHAWIEQRHGAWTPADLRAALGPAAWPEASGGPARAECEVVKLLATYAEKVAGARTVADLYRRIYMEFMMGPGDDGVFKARYPNVQTSTKNAVKTTRGGKFFAAVFDRAALDPDRILRAAAQEFPGRADDADMMDTMNARSKASLHEEVAGLCAFHCLMESKHTLPWKERFVFSRGTYRTAERIGLLAPYPVLLVASNTYDVLYRGKILKTTSLFASIAWWLEIMRVAHRAELPKYFCAFKVPPVPRR